MIQSVRILRSVLFICILSCFCANESAVAQPSETNKSKNVIRTKIDLEISKTLNGIRKKYGLPGMGAAVAKCDMVKIAVSGKRRVDRDEKLLINDMFHIGSCGKAITASIVGRLVDRGILGWDDTLKETLNDAIWLPEEYQGITLDMLLRHASGIPHSIDLTTEFLDGFSENWSLVKQRTWFVQRILTHSPKFIVGAHFEYSNWNYVLIGHIIERTTGKSWEELVQKEVFEPLGIEDWGLGATSTGKNPEGNWGHKMVSDKYVPTDFSNPDLIAPAGLVHFSLSSWARFAIAHVCPESNGWISKTSMQHLHDPLELNGGPAGKGVALGWGVSKTTPIKLTHDGSDGTIYARIVAIPEYNTAVIVTCNAGDESAEKAVHEISDILVSQVIK